MEVNVLTEFYEVLHECFKGSCAQKSSRIGRAIRTETGLQPCCFLCVGTVSLFKKISFGKIVWRTLVSFSSNQVKSLLKKCIKCGKLGCCDNKSADVSKFKQHCEYLHTTHIWDKTSQDMRRYDQQYALNCLGTFRPQNAMRSCYYVCTMLIITYVFVSSWWKSDFICWLA